MELMPRPASGYWWLALVPLAGVALAWATPLPAVVAPIATLSWALLLRRRPQAALPIQARRSAIAVLVGLTGLYLLWRLSATLNLSSPLATALSLLLLLAEAVLLGHGLLQLLLAWFPLPPVAQEVERAAQRLAQRSRQPSGNLPWVDVVVPSCGEAPDLVERSLRGCLALAYPRFTVWLLDDGQSEALRQLCQQLGCRYLRRSGRQHAKAGNLNHALPQLQGSLLAVFDADVVPERTFLQRTVGLFFDRGVGLVQTPQSYMTADPVIRNLGLERWLMPDEELFYRWIQPTRQAIGAVVCAGTSFVVRRAALTQVGGFETGTTSEDLATGIRITAAGYRTVYVNEKLSAGLAPPSLAAMAHQRSRWASGTLQTLRTGANPLRIPGLGPWQRLAYLEGILHWCNVLPQLVLLLMPLSVGLLGVVPLQIPSDGVVAVAGPLVLAQLLLVRWFSHGSRSALMPELYRWVFLAPLLQAVVATLAGWPLSFQVTPKALGHGPNRPAAALVLPLLLMLTLQLVNLGLQLAGIARGTIPTSSSQGFSLLWSSLASLVLLAALRTCWDRPPGDAWPWFRPLQGQAWLSQAGMTWPATVLAISEQGVELQLSAAALQRCTSDHRSPLTLAAPGLGGQPWPLRLVVARGRLLGGLWQAALPLPQRQRQLYQQPGLWPVRQAPSEPLALLALLGRLLAPSRPLGWFWRSSLPIQL